MIITALRGSYDVYTQGFEKRYTDDFFEEWNKITPQIHIRKFEEQTAGEQVPWWESFLTSIGYSGLVPILTLLRNALQIMAFEARSTYAEISCGTVSRHDFADVAMYGLISFRVYCRPETRPSTVSIVDLSGKK